MCAFTGGEGDRELVGTHPPVIKGENKVKTLSKIWVSAFNGSELRLLKYKGPNQDLELLEDLKFEKPHQLSQDLISSKRGRIFLSASKNRSAMERTIDPHEKAKLEALQASIQYLEKYADAFDRLVLAAPPRILGELRKILPESIKRKEIVELHKDITHLHVKEMPSHLKEVLNIHKHTFQPPQTVHKK